MVYYEAKTAEGYFIIRNAYLAYLGEKKIEQKIHGNKSS